MHLSISQHHYYSSPPHSQNNPLVAFSVQSSPPFSHFQSTPFFTLSAPNLRTPSALHCPYISHSESPWRYPFHNLTTHHFIPSHNHTPTFLFLLTHFPAPVSACRHPRYILPDHHEPKPTACKPLRPSSGTTKITQIQMTKVQKCQT